MRAGAGLDLDPGAEVGEVRATLRRLIDEHVPEDFLGAFTDDPVDQAVADRFCRVLAAAGMLCPAWPQEWGGRGASIWAQMAVREEMWAHHEPRGAQYMGVNWVGPAILRHGTDEQRQRHLPPIARGEVIWCQGFSEPDAGSDLASLRTAARPADGGWRISGQKVWTSYAGLADWCFLLARTGEGTRPHEGITVFLVPMTTPGIEVRPLASILGPHHLNEVFLDDVDVGPDHVLGAVGGGWRIVQEVLAFERVGIARYARCERLLHRAPAVLGPRWEQVPEALRARWVEAQVHARRARLLAYDVLAAQEHGDTSPATAAAYRIAVTRLDQDSAEVLVELARWADPASADGARFRRAVEDHWRYAQAATVASGSIEVQRMLLARALVGRR